MHIHTSGGRHELFVHGGLTAYTWHDQGSQQLTRVAIWSKVNHYTKEFMRRYNTYFEDPTLTHGSFLNIFFQKKIRKRFVSALIVLNCH